MCLDQKCLYSGTDGVVLKVDHPPIIVHFEHLFLTLMDKIANSHLKTRASVDL
uniref:Uncharacterized protein n=1 Tax=Arundo donax TaxID=35708 RepID=A0A0A9DVT7_ARUDO